MNFFQMMRGAAGTAIILSLPQAAFAAPAVATDSAVFVERLEPGNIRSLALASRLSRGDRVVTVVTWRRMGGDGGFTITNPMPRAISYQASTRDDEEVSIDGGRTWGRLGELRIGGRYATPEDVTHIRWRVPAGNARGRIAYSGIVR
ncbi:MAG TPA: hypothetical protein VGE05_13855 [Novosphingobium sp.]